MGQRFFIWWLDMTRRRARAVVVVTGLLAVLGVWLVADVSFDANILRLLPRQAPAVRSFQTFLQTFGSLDQLYVVFTAPEGHAIGEYGDVVTAWADALRSETKRYVRGLMLERHLAVEIVSRLVERTEMIFDLRFGR